MNYRDELEKGIRSFYRDTVKVVLRNPRHLAVGLKVVANQFRAARIRNRHNRRGEHIPPFMIFSVTERCNLSCKGCYARALQAAGDGELSSDRIRSLWREAQELGFGTVLVAGGEPLMRPDILALAAEFPRLLFPVFTNGTLIDSRFIALCRKHGNIVPVLSIEGSRSETDDRRGEGVFSRVAGAIELLRKSGVFCGVSVTVSKNNFGTVVDRAFVREFHRRGARLFFFIEYVAADQASSGLLLDPAQSRLLTDTVGLFRSAFDALFIAFPGDEERFGGCLAAGRGFVHVNPHGDLEACPVAPFSDVNLSSAGLSRGLSSPVLAAIRRNHHLLEESAGGCSLWDKRDQVKKMLESERLVNKS